MDKATLSGIIECLPGITYIVDLEGRVIFYGSRAWEKFAEENNAHDLTKTENVIGKSLFDFIDGEEMKQTYQLYHRLLLSKKLDKINFFCSCDSPETVRDIFLSVCPLVIKSKMVGFVYYSLTIREELRPPIGLLVQTKADDLPLIKMCSFCKRIAHKDLDGSLIWITAETYYNLGGQERVSLSHGICPDCYARNVQPFRDLAK